MALPEELTARGLSAWTERFGGDDPMLLASIFPSRGNITAGNLVGWDRVDMGRDAAGFQAYNQHGEQVDLSTLNRKTAVAPTMRETKRIPGEYIQWLNAPGSETQPQGRAAVEREMRDLRMRFSKRQEIMRSQILCGGVISGAIGVDTTAISVDYGMLATHSTTSWATAWDTAGTDIIANLIAGILLCEQDGGVTPDTLLCGSNVPGYLANNTAIQAIMSERQKSELYSGQITRIPGVELDVQSYRKGYVTAGTFTPYIGADAVVLYAKDMGGEGTYTIECSSPDARAGTAQRGVYVHAWDEEQPPAGVWISMELTALPVLANPEAIAYDSDVS